MDELANHCKGLSLSDREGPTFDLEEEMATLEFIIAAKFFTRRALNMEAIASTFQPLWRSKTGFKVKNMGNHIVLFIFDNKHEVETILENEPWSFDKHLMVLQRYDKDTPVEELKFNYTSFWVQVHDIPVRFMNQKVAAGICSQVDTVIKKPEAEGEGGSFMRVRVRVDITIPLSQGRRVSGQGKEICVSFKYERLPNICYWYGCLNHDDRDCLFKKPNGVSSTPQNSTNPRKRHAQSTVVQPPQESLADVEFTQTKNSMSPLRGTVTKGHIYSPPVAEQLQNNSPINEARNEFSSFYSPNSVHNNEPSNSPPVSVQHDPFLSTLAEIDEDFSKLNVRSAPNNEDTRIRNLSHAINEELEAARVSNKEVEAARVFHAQGINDKEVSVLQTKRSHEQLSNLNGLPSKKHMVSFEINSSTKAEADDQPRQSQ
ncbi:uncharacterized protein LOC115990508 [Quercus lobata]|uniref:uncharacterized protein LOC115990508 n=1 Tax=Quercus lobata TaxID=97700 RepID=UPI0012474AFC|nr:uncharacterized protein LOC115990508 [Quercus lobata]